MADFSSLKKNRGNFQTLQKKLEDEKKGGFTNDREGWWKLTVDKAGNGYAVIRFLPAPADEEYPYVRMYSHGFKNKQNGKWYIENSRTTIGEDDPLGELNSEMWNTNDPEKQDIVRQRKRRLEYFSNILVIQDSAAPENEGKTFKFAYGARIFQKIEGALKPEFADETPFNPFDLWEGANFKLKARILDGQRSYDKSGFDAPSALFDGDDAALEKLWKSLPSLAEEVAPDKFESYDALKKKLEDVLGTGGSRSSQKPKLDEDEEEKPKRDKDEPRRETPEPEKEEEDPDLAKYRALLADD